MQSLSNQKVFLFAIAIDVACTAPVIDPTEPDVWIESPSSTSSTIESVSQAFLSKQEIAAQLRTQIKWANFQADCDKHGSIKRALVCTYAAKKTLNNNPLSPQEALMCKTQREDCEHDEGCKLEEKTETVY